MNPRPKPAELLVVDDDVGIVTLMTQTLREEGHKARGVRSGAEALGWLQNHSPDLLLLDLELNDMTAQELLRRLGETAPVPPFVIITGQGDERVAVELMKQGALDYVVKDSVFLDLLPSIVGRILDRIERERALAAAQEALRQSQREILSIVDGEQRRIGQDLHDSLGQYLAAIGFRLHALSQDLEASDLTALRDELKCQADEVGRLIRESIDLCRSLARGLVPVRLEAHGLMDALDELARRTNGLRGIRCRFQCAKPVALASSQTASQLFRIAQEAVNNALKHANASEIVISLTQRPRAIVLAVRDDGAGLGPAKNPPEGLGFSVMRHRANVIGASLDIRSAPNRGVTVLCTVPLESS